MRSLGSSDGGVLPAGSPDGWGGMADGPASAHLRTPRLQTHSFILRNHSRQPWSYRITVHSFRSQMYERDSGGSGVSARSVRPFHRAGPLAGVHTALGLAGCLGAVHLRS